MVDPVRTIHLELTFIIIIGQYPAVAIQIDIVSRFGIHQNLHGGFGGDVQIKVEPHIATGGFLFACFLTGLAVQAVGM